MADLTIYRDNYVDSTVVSNLFIDQYMKDANDAQLKVYLYLVRMLSADRPTSISDIADKFNHTEKDILRSLKYWEKQGLLSLEYDTERNLSGIRMCNLREVGGADPAPQPAAERTVVLSSRSIEPFRPAVQVSLDQNSPREEAKTYAKPSYSADQLREFQRRDNTAQLLFIAEQYIGRPLSPSEMKTILFFTDELHFSDDLIDYLLQYCVDRQKKDFKYIEKVAVRWAQEGITTPKQAQQAAYRYDKNVYQIMNELGKSGSPTTRELDFILRWTREYGFATDIIVEACQRTVLATDSHRFEYADGILKSWKQANVHHKADIARIDELHQKKKPATKAVSTNKFNQFAQNSYDFSDLEKQLVSN